MTLQSQDGDLVSLDMMTSRGPFTPRLLYDPMKREGSLCFPMDSATEMIHSASAFAADDNVSVCSCKNTREDFSKPLRIGLTILPWLKMKNDP